MKKNYKLKIFIALIISVNISFAQVNVVADSSFEAGTPNTAWAEASLNFGTPLCDATECGNCGGPCFARTGAWYAWFGGITAIETASLTQSVIIPAGNAANLSFWFKLAIVGTDPNDSITVQLDGNSLWTAKNADATTYAEYTEVVISIDAYADGAAHSLSFSSSLHGVSLSNFLVDDVSIITETATGVHSNYLVEGISVYPNPAVDKLNIVINAPLASDYEIILYNMLGQKIYSSIELDLQNGKIEIPTSNLVKGTYQLLIRNELETTVQKIIIE